MQNCKLEFSYKLHRRFWNFFHQAQRTSFFISFFFGFTSLYEHKNVFKNIDCKPYPNCKVSRSHDANALFWVANILTKIPSKVIRLTVFYYQKWSDQSISTIAVRENFYQLFIFEAMLCKKFARGLQSYEAKSFTTLITPLCLGKKVRILIKNCSRNIIL